MTLPFASSRQERQHAPVTLVLGPTNTGKTHYAIERMLAHRSGMIGLPLRLLAREVYNRVVEKIGADSVALVTGEEKLKGRNPRYWICTVEAMPRDLDLAFVAVDEVQLAADLDRGHTFTDRILKHRGSEETMLIGAQTMERALLDLLPDAHVVSRPRLSKLTFAGERKIARLPPRTAVVAFSAEEVYAIAEWIRRQRGGAAVVLGALSPRTRNSQVELYQSGDVDYIVATDAIGMGLNLDVDHVAFAGDRKFDGWHYRRLNPAEFGQIAGRAGRYVRDGTFGSTGRCSPFDNDLVAMLEDHRFDPIRMLQWRNSDLDTSSIEDLVATLDALPNAAGLTRAPLATDQMALDIASRDSEVRKVARNRGDVARLWECCQIPDYRKLSPAAHSELVLNVYRFIVRAGRIPDDWFAQHVSVLDRTDGEIDTIAARIAQVRTWTFIANRPDWLRDPEHWQGVTRRVEDTLSDALHERLAQRFVDRRTSVLRRRLRENAIMEAEITSSGDVLVENQHVGQLNGFRFTSDPQASGEEARTLNAAAQKALASEIEGRATRVHEAVDEAFVLANDGLIRWLGEPVGRLSAGSHILEPQVRVIADEQLTGPALEMVQRRLDLWIKQHVQKLLGVCIELEAGAGLEGIARGIAFQIGEALGVLERSKVADELRTMSQDARASLRKLGVRFGAYHLYLPALIKPAPRALAAQLWALKNGGPETIKGGDDVPHLAASGRTSFVADPAVPKGFYRAAGFRVCGERAVRVDILERLADLIRPAIAYRPGTTPGDPPPGAADNDGFVVTIGMTSLAGCSAEAFGSVLKSLGYVLDRRPGPAITVPLVPKAAVEPVHAEPAALDETVGAVAHAAQDVPAENDALTAQAEAGTGADEGSEPNDTAAPPDGPRGEDLETRVSLARQSELIAAALEGGALDAIEPLPKDGGRPIAEPHEPGTQPAQSGSDGTSAIEAAGATHSAAVDEGDTGVPAAVAVDAPMDAPASAEHQPDAPVASEHQPGADHAAVGPEPDPKAADHGTAAGEDRPSLEAGGAGAPMLGAEAVAAALHAELPDEIATEALNQAGPAEDGAGTHAPAEAPRATTAGEETGSTDAPASDKGAIETTPVEASAGDGAAAEPVLIEVWRPHRQNAHHRRSGDQRQRGPRRFGSAGAGSDRRPGNAEAPLAATGEGAASPESGGVPGSEGRNNRGRQGRRFGGAPGAGQHERGGERRFGRRDGPQRADGQQGQAADGQAAAGQPNQDNRQRHHRNEKRDGEARGRGPRDHRSDRRDNNAGVNGGGREDWRGAQGNQQRSRDRQPDPNSPFAKLAALKAQLEKEKS